MTSLRNSVKLIGYLGADPEIKTLEGGKVVAKFSLATSENYKNTRGEKVISTEWHRLVAWGKVAELLQKYARKGTEIAVEGKLMHHSYEDKEGITRYVTEVRVNELLFLSKALAS
jgi:single-strand DNA-binding protein